MLGLILLPLAEVVAQVSVEVTLEQEHFLAGEALPVAVRIHNRSGQTLRLGTEPDWLTFSVESRDGFIVAKLDDPPVREEFTLGSSKVATVRANLSPCFTLTRHGRYSVTAAARISAWDKVVTSPARSFDIIEAAKLWTQEFGVPVAGVSNQPPEVRRFTLLQANYLRTQLRLYFRLTDPAELKVFKVFPLGPMVSFGQPEQRVDGRNHLHVLHQNGARSALYNVITPDGDVALRHTYDFQNSRPRLTPDGDGAISVTGGVRRATPDDLPAEPKPETTVKPPQS